MASFDGELKQSVRELQGAVAALQQTTEKQNNSLRTMGTLVKGVAGGHREAAAAAATHGGVVDRLHQSHSALGAGAKAAGGEGGKMVKEFAHLASFNPIALAAGAAIGFIADNLSHAIEEADKLKESLDGMGVKTELALTKAAHGAALDADVQGMRAKGFKEFIGKSDDFADVPEKYRESAKQAAEFAIGTGQAKDNREVIDRLMKANAFQDRKSGNDRDFSLKLFGFDKQVHVSGTRQRSPEELAAIAANSEFDPNAIENFRRFRSTRKSEVIEAADTEQFVHKMAAQNRAEDLLRINAGQQSEANATLLRIEQALKSQVQIRDGNATLFGGKSMSLFWSQAQRDADRKIESLTSEYNTTLSQMTTSTR